MSQCWIETKPIGNTDSEIFQLNVTTDFNLKYSNQVSSHPVVDRTNIVDNYIKENTTISINGGLSDIKNYIMSRNGKPQRDSAESIALLLKIRDSGTPFTLHLSNELQPFLDCVFTSLTFTKGSGYGSSYDVSFEITQIIPSTQVSLSLERFTQNAITNDQSASKSDGGTKPTEEVGSLTLAASLVAGFANFVINPTSYFTSGG